MKRLAFVLLGNPLHRKHLLVKELFFIWWQIDNSILYQHTKPAMTFIKQKGVPFEARSASWERLLH
jgi:hypothetical protein